MPSEGSPTILRRLWGVLPAGARSRLVSSLTAVLSDKEKFRRGSPSVRGFLENLLDNGFAPATVLDIGANVGNWARMAGSVFPAARIILFEANPDHLQTLQAAAADLGNGAQVRLTLLGAEKREAVPFFKLGTGSSVLPELSATERQLVSLPMDTLDGQIEGLSIETPLLIKMDVQGYELTVLRGGSRTLERAEVVIMEVSVVLCNEGAPLFAEVVAFMAERGFVVFDFCGQSREPASHALLQTDVVFVRANSRLRGEQTHSSV